MNCPKCGYERQSRDDAFVPPGECPVCGVVYAKHDSTQEPDETARSVPVPNLRPSPVDALSLRKARDRVEKKLREQQRKRVPDDRRAKTLELAKQLASEELRKRQEQWKQTHAEEEASAAAEVSAPATEAEAAPEEVSWPDHPTPLVDQAADDMLAEAEEKMEALPDSQTPDAENPQEPVDDADTAAAWESQNDPDAEPDDESMTGAADAAPEDAFASDASPSVDPGAQIPEPPEEMPAAHVAAAALSHAPKLAFGAGLPRLLPVVAWLILAAGVIGAVLSWTTISEVEAGARIPTAEGMNGLPLGLLLGFAYLATGVLGFAFFWVSSLISTQLRDIQHLLQPPNREDRSLPDEAV
jgi:hypothetical protein